MNRIQLDDYSGDRIFTPNVEAACRELANGLLAHAGDPGDNGRNSISTLRKAVVLSTEQFWLNLLTGS